MLMEAWKADAEYQEHDHYHWINNTGCLSVEEIQAIARQVWRWAMTLQVSGETWSDGWPERLCCFLRWRLFAKCRDAAGDLLTHSSSILLPRECAPSSSWDLFMPRHAVTVGHYGFGHPQSYFAIVSAPCSYVWNVQTDHKFPLHCRPYDWVHI